MTIPDYETTMLPIVKFFGDNKEHSFSDVLSKIYQEFNVTEEEKRELLPSGTDLVVRNRVRWARLYLERAGLVETIKRATYRVTKRGLEVLAEKPAKIDVKYLSQFPEFVKFRGIKKEKKETTVQKKITESLNPMELFENSYQKIRNELSEDLLREIRKASPTFFEKLVIDLLIRMGYGGSRKDAGKAIGQRGDQGIDGIIKEDKLGLDTIYIQAKRWEGTVGRPEIHKFVGALKGQGASKGIFITTSNFSDDAREYAAKIDSPKIVLIDGDKLTELMIEDSVGLAEVGSYPIKKIDLDYFSEE